MEQEITLRGIAVGIHATTAAIWVGVAACFVIAALILGFDEEGDPDFIPRVAPRVTIVSLVCAAISITAGLAVLVVTLWRTGFELSSTYTTVTSIKGLMFIGMLWAVLESRQLERVYRSRITKGTPTEPVKRQLVQMYGLCTILGAVALALGIWVLGG
ncbi:MAG: hypothetical protein ACREQF_00635 [Candidatus Binataceae bacterium]